MFGKCWMHPGAKCSCHFSFMICATRGACKKGTLLFARTRFGEKRAYNAEHCASGVGLGGPRGPARLIYIIYPKAGVRGPGSELDAKGGGPAGGPEGAHCIYCM